MRDHGQIRRLLPQRYPMLLLDQVLDLVPGESVHAIKAVTACEPCYQGIAETVDSDAWAYPVSLLLESFGQAAALLWIAGREAGAEGVLLFGAARNCRIHSAAYPGDLLCHRIRLDAQIGDTAFASGTTSIGDRLVAEVGTFAATVRPSSAVRPHINNRENVTEREAK
ncbi:3-hydroxyacyl-ACP dehydratase FabZ family protein [Nocardia brasiliensis]|uniref:3-hydroxyacyl-ACP dehydratase FabZ family protein n=1 Tax=Nocardia brasiliensis TaxID=37326 RepID=UPI00367198E2